MLRRLICTIALLTSLCAHSAIVRWDDLSGSQFYTVENFPDLTGNPLLGSLGLTGWTQPAVDDRIPFGNTGATPLVYNNALSGDVLFWDGGVNIDNGTLSTQASHESLANATPGNISAEFSSTLSYDTDLLPSFQGTPNGSITSGNNLSLIFEIDSQMQAMFSADSLDNSVGSNGETFVSLYHVNTDTFLLGIDQFVGLQSGNLTLEAGLYVFSAGIFNGTTEITEFNLDVQRSLSTEFNLTAIPIPAPPAFALLLLSMIAALGKRRIRLNDANEGRS